MRSGGMFPKMLLTHLPALADKLSSLAAGCRLILGLGFPARDHAAKRLGNTTLYALLMRIGIRRLRGLQFVANGAKWCQMVLP